MNETLHLGKKISRLRELRGIKQETLAEQLGISQQAVSKIEQSQHVENATLERIGKVLGLSSAAIKNFNDEAVFFHIENINDQGSAYNNAYNYQCTFNPLDEYRNEVQENKRLVEENKKLYEALLKAEREKVALLERLLGEKR